MLITYSYYDFITILDRLLYPFYSAYHFESKEEITIDATFNLKKTEHIIEKGVIERIFLTDDLFIIDINGVKFSRQSKILLSQFMDTLKKIKSDEEKRAFIIDQSRLIKRLDYEKKIEIKHKGKMLINFFKIQGKDLYNEPIFQINQNKYTWGKFEIEMDESLRDEYFQIVEQIKLKN